MVPHTPRAVGSEEVLIAAPTKPAVLVTSFGNERFPDSPLHVVLKLDATKFTEPTWSSHANGIIASGFEPHTSVENAHFEIDMIKR